jgi:hypothetical protein
VGKREQEKKSAESSAEPFDPLNSVMNGWAQSNSSIVSTEKQTASHPNRSKFDNITIFLMKMEALTEAESKIL